MNLLDKLGLGGQRSAERIDENTLAVTRTSVQTGKVHTINLPITAEQWEQYERGAFIQTALGHLSSDQREFILSGMTQEDWDDFAKTLDNSEDPENG